MKIHILMDNYVKKRGLIAEHGLSIYIESEGVHVLFDSGQSAAYCSNAEHMGVDLKKTDYVVLSHGHYDHCGGLIHLPYTDRFPFVFAHPAAFAKKYAINPDRKSYREIGIPWSLENHVDIKNQIRHASQITPIAPNISLCGEIPSTTPFEGIPEGFYTGEEFSKSNDMFLDEQMLVYDGEKGLCVFLGCSHPGVINGLNHTLRHFPGKKIDTVVAGMHLDRVSPLRLQMTIQTMMDLDIQRVIPLHCTGMFAICEMKRFLGNRCVPMSVGDSLEI